MGFSRQNKVGIAFALGLACIIAVGVLQYRTAREFLGQNQWATHAEDVLRELMAVRNDLNRADASTQSFVLSGDTTYVDSFNKVEAKTHERMGNLRHLTLDNPEQQQKVNELTPQVDSSLRVLVNEVDARKNSKVSPPAPAPPVQKTFTDARVTISEMEAAEIALLQKRREAAGHSNQQANLLILLGSLMALIFIGAAGVALYFDVMARRLAEEHRLRALQALQSAKHDLEKEIEQKRQAETKLQASEQSLRQLSFRLLRTQDEERRRIGRELHDSVGQYLAGLGMELDALKTMAPPERDPELLSKLSDCQDLAETCIKEVRTMSYLLHPPMLEEMGLILAIPWYVSGLSKRSGMPITTSIPPAFGRLPYEVEIAMFRILQESLTNIHRHSGSATANVRLMMEEGAAVLEVEDHGKGLPQHIKGEVQPGTSETTGIGLQGMQERVRYLGGTLQVISSERGTTIRATVPCAMVDAQPTAISA